MDSATVQEFPKGMLTVAQLIDAFKAELSVLVATGQRESSTLIWYKFQLAKLQAIVGARPADQIRASDLVSVKFTHHFVRAIKALYRWAVEEGHVPKNPFTKLKTPACGQRSRTLKRQEMTRLYSVVSPDFRRFLFLLAHTLMRPGELRTLRWRDVRPAERLILLTKFKGQKLRKDNAAIRPIPLDRPAARMLVNLHARRNPHPDDLVFPGPNGKGWTSNALRCRLRRAREKAHLNQKGQELVVCYTLRHTGATEATKRGIRDRTLAEIMGHTTTRTTARYQHLDAASLVDAIDGARKPRK